ncbi:MAG: hypothetical protein AB7O62_19625 [Pirellulales bacterium]
MSVGNVSVSFQPAPGPGMFYATITATGVEAPIGTALSATRVIAKLLKSDQFTVEIPEADMVKGTNPTTTYTKSWNATPVAAGTYYASVRVEWSIRHDEGPAYSGGTST